MTLDIRCSPPTSKYEFNLHLHTFYTQIETRTGHHRCYVSVENSDLRPKTLAASYWHLPSVLDFSKKFTIVVNEDESLAQKFHSTQELLLEYSWDTSLIAQESKHAVCNHGTIPKTATDKR